MILYFQKKVILLRSEIPNRLSKAECHYHSALILELRNSLIVINNFRIL